MLDAFHWVLADSLSARTHIWGMAEISSANCSAFSLAVPAG